LGLIAVADVEVEPGPAPAGAPIVGDDQTMRQALDVLVTTGCAVAVVRATDGRRRGVLTLERISKELAS